MCKGFEAYETRQMVQFIMGIALDLFSPANNFAFAALSRNELRDGEKNVAAQNRIIHWEFNCCEMTRSGECKS